MPIYTTMFVLEDGIIHCSPFPLIFYYKNVQTLKS